MVTSPHWWDDKRLVTGKYEKDEFVARVMDHIADQYDGPVGSDPPTWDFPRMGAGSDKTQEAQRRGHVALPMDTCGDTLPPGTHGPDGRDNAFPSTCGSGSRGT